MERMNESVYLRPASTEGRKEAHRAEKNECGKKRKNG
jgi:hypothetical protein